MRKKYSKALSLTLALGLLFIPAANAMATSNFFESTKAVTETTEEAVSSNPLTEIDNLAVTPENLGIPGEEHYGIQYYARNIWDMTAIDGKVLLSMGDYGTNTGAVPIYYYTNDSTEKSECTYKSVRTTSGLSSEEIKRFYNIDGTVYATATDPLGMGQGSYYKFDSATNQWTDYYKLPLNIHCYDMVEYDGEIFFAGMVRDNEQHIVSCVQKLNKDDLCSSKFASSVSFYYADGTEFPAEWVTSTYEGIEYKSFDTDYWRAYDIFVFQGELYVAHSANSAYTLTTHSGLFKYDKENNRFIQVYDGNVIKGFMSVTRNASSITYVNGNKTDVHYSFEDNTPTIGALTVGQEEIYGEPTCGAKISTEDTFVAVCNGIFKSSDVINFEQVSLGKGYENYVTRDAFEKDGKYYFLASVKNGTDDFTTAVFETDENFEEFRRVLYFDTQSFARSFVYNEGYLYIGLGGNGRIDNIGDSVGSKYSGTLYRINLEELISDKLIEIPEESVTETTEESTTEAPEVTTEEVIEETPEKQQTESSVKTLESIIVSDGNFSTGLNINQDCSIEMTFSLSSMEQYRNIYLSDAYVLRNEASKGLYARHGWYNANVYTPTVNEDITVLQDKNVTYINGNQVLKATPQTIQSSTDLTFGYFKGSIKSFRVWDGSDTLVADYIPVLDADNNACMYDKVSGTYCYYSGTCTAGKVVEDTTTQVTPDTDDNTSVHYVDKLQLKGGNFNSGIIIDQDYSIQIVGSLSDAGQYKNLYYSDPYTLRNEASRGLFARHGWYNDKVYVPVVNEEFTVLQKKNITYVNGTQVQKATYQVIEDSETLKFGDYKGTITSFCIWDSSDTLVADYVPALDENNVACLYNRVSKDYVYYSGTCEVIEK